jgi:F-type H+-transporting ATPase subunit epsilon
MKSEYLKPNSNHKLTLEIVTPEQLVYSDVVDYVSVSGLDGTLGILPNHCALISMLQPGELRIGRGEDEISFAISSGFLDVRQNRIIVLVDMAEKRDEIDAQKVEATTQNAILALNKSEISGIYRSEAEESLRFEMTCLKLIEKRKKK